MASYPADSYSSPPFYFFLKVSRGPFLTFNFAFHIVSSPKKEFLHLIFIETIRERFSPKEVTRRGGPRGIFYISLLEEVP